MTKWVKTLKIDQTVENGLKIKKIGQNLETLSIFRKFSPKSGMSFTNDVRE